MQFLILKKTAVADVHLFLTLATLKPLLLHMLWLFDLTNPPYAVWYNFEKTNTFNCQTYSSEFGWMSEKFPMMNNERPHNSDSQLQW